MNFAVVNKVEDHFEFVKGFDRKIDLSKYEGSLEDRTTKVGVEWSKWIGEADKKSYDFALFISDKFDSRQAIKQCESISNEDCRGSKIYLSLDKYCYIVKMSRAWDSEAFKSANAFIQFIIGCTEVGE